MMLANVLYIIKHTNEYIAYQHVNEGVQAFTFEIQKVVKLNRLLQAACISHLKTLFLFEFSFTITCMNGLFVEILFFSGWNCKWSEHKHFYDT